MNKTEKIIMELNITNLQLLNSLHLSQVEYSVLRYVKAETFTESKELASALKITIPYASALLRKLASKGYLSRKEVPDKTGGSYFEYVLSKELMTIKSIIP